MWLLAILLGLLVFAGRSALVFYAGSPVPFHDQWIAEADQLIVPDASHAVTVLGRASRMLTAVAPGARTYPAVAAATTTPPQNPRW